MAAWDTLIAEMIAVIKTNGLEEITGRLLQDSLKNIIETLGENWDFGGVATPGTAPGAPDGPIFYIAGEAGIYSNFGGITLDGTEVNVFSWDGTGSAEWVATGFNGASKTSVVAINSKIRNNNLGFANKPEYISSQGTEKTNSVQGIYTLDQEIGETPAFTGVGYKTFTHQFVANPSVNYTPQIVFCKDTKGANEIYRSVLIVDETGAEVFKTNQSGDFSFYLYHNWQIQVTCDRFFIDSVEASILDKLTEIDSDVAENTEDVLYCKNGLASNQFLSKYIDVDKGAVRVLQDSQTWQAATTLSKTENLEGIDVNGIEYIMPPTIGTNSNIVGFRIINNVTAITGDKVKFSFAIKSDKVVSDLDANVDFSSSAKINYINVNSLAIGWNFIEAEVEFLIDNPTVSFLVFRGLGLLGATLFVTSAFKTNNTYFSNVDYSLSNLEGRLQDFDLLKYGIDGISKKIQIDENYDYEVWTNIDSWQLDTIKTVGSLFRNETEIKGTELQLGALEAAEGGANANIFGFKLNVLGRDLLAGETITVIISVWSDRDMSELNPALYFSNGNGQILDTDFTSLKSGWNTKYVRVSVTANEVAGEQQIILFSRDDPSNKASLVGATIFLSDFVVCADKMTMLDFNLIQSLKRIKASEDAISQIENRNFIACVGDSLTVGIGADKTRNKATVISVLQALGVDTSVLSTVPTPYPLVMSEIINNIDLDVVNMGVGGETINTIAARQGASPAVIQGAFVLQATAGAKTQIANSSTFPLVASFDRASSVLPLIQGEGSSVNPCYIDGIPCTLSVFDDSGVYRYEITRNETGSRSVLMPADTQIIMKGAKDYRNPKAAIIWCWQNGGYSTNEELIEKLEKIVSNVGTSNYIIVGLHTHTLAIRQEQERALESKFGSRFFNWRRYVSSNALEDFGITPTTDSDFTVDQLANGVKSDTTAIAEGSLPSSFWRLVYGIDGSGENDVVHMNSAGYLILGWKLVELLKINGVAI